MASIVVCRDSSLCFQRFPPYLNSQHWPLVFRMTPTTSKSLRELNGCRMPCVLPVCHRIPDKPTVHFEPPADTGPLTDSWWAWDLLTAIFSLNVIHHQPMRLHSLCPWCNAGGIVTSVSKTKQLRLWPTSLPWKQSKLTYQEFETILNPLPSICDFLSRIVLITPLRTSSHYHLE